MTEPPLRCHHASAPAKPESVRGLRRVGAVCLDRWGLPGLLDTVELLISELATNAIRHGSGAGIDLLLLRTIDRVQIEVVDGNPEPPIVHAPAADRECGRGMAIVEALASTWGTGRNGESTWCTVTIDREVTA